MSLFWIGVLDRGSASRFCIEAADVMRSMPAPVVLNTLFEVTRGGLAGLLRFRKT
jgi:hypothetical protein